MTNGFGRWCNSGGDDVCEEVDVTRRIWIMASVLAMFVAAGYSQTAPAPVAASGRSSAANRDDAEKAGMTGRS